MRAEYGFSHAFTISLCRSGRNGRLTGAGRLCPERNRSSSLLRATPPFSCIHCRSNLTVARSMTSNSSSYAGQTGLRGLRNILFVLISPLLPMSQQSTSCWIRRCKRQYIFLQQFTLVSRWWARDIHSSHRLVSELHLRSPRPQSPRCISSGWTRAAWGRWLSQFPRKKGHTRSEPFPERKAHNARTPFPQEQSARALRPNTYRTDRVCHLASENADTDRHTS